LYALCRILSIKCLTVRFLSNAGQIKQPLLVDIRSVHFTIIDIADVLRRFFRALAKPIA
jgi:hypothetical protein